MDHYTTPQVVFIEGIQGSGKSTLAKSLAEQLRSNHPKAKIYLKSESPNPIDVCRLACFSPNSFSEFLGILAEETNFPWELLSAEIAPYVSVEDGLLFTNWYGFLSHHNLHAPIALSFALDQEICDGKTGPEHYLAVTAQRWRNFAKNIDPQGIYIFEGCLFQHPLAEMMGYHLLCDEQIESYVLSLLNILENIPMKLYYIRVGDIESILSHAAEDRRGERNDWLRGFLKMTTTCNYGVKHGFSGMSGALAYCRERIRIEEKLLKELTIPVTFLSRK